MSDTKFSKEHEWITLDGEVGTIGITKHATEIYIQRFCEDLTYFIIEIINISKKNAINISFLAKRLK